MKKILIAALIALAAACGPNWGYLCVGDNCPGGAGGGGVDQTPADPDAGCPIDEPDPVDPPDSGEPTDPPDSGTPTDPPDSGSPTDPPDGGNPTDPPDSGDGKTCICHIPKGNPSNKHTICIGEPALSAHLKHGDFLGPCNW